MINCFPFWDHPSSWVKAGLLVIGKTNGISQKVIRSQSSSVSWKCLLPLAMFREAWQWGGWQLGPWMLCPNGQATLQGQSQSCCLVMSVSSLAAGGTCIAPAHLLNVFPQARSAEQPAQEEQPVDVTRTGKQQFHWLDIYCKD